MKVLLFYKAVENVPLQPMWDALGHHCELKRIALGRAEVRDLSAFFDTVSFEGYDRVLVDQTVGRLRRQYRALRKVPNLVLRDQDACQHAIPASDLYRRLDTVYRDIGDARIVVANKICQQQFRDAGIDCVYLPKAVDPHRIHSLGGTRDIEVGYVGRLKHDAYRGRRRFLERLRRRVDVALLRTPKGDDAAYNATLNRIRFFVSADIGFNEYMFKNFEAMAAGCVLVAKRQPAVEQEALGFVDMENIVLYDDLDECLDKLSLLKRTPGISDRIADAGRRLVLERHTLERRGHELHALLEPPIRAAPPPSRWEKLYRLKLAGRPL